MANLDISFEEPSRGKISSSEGVSTPGRLKRIEENRQGAPIDKLRWSLFCYISNGNEGQRYIEDLLPLDRGAANSKYVEQLPNGPTCSG